MVTAVRCARLCSMALLNVALSLFWTMCFLGLSPTTSAQEHRIITFEAPGADTTVGDDNGTYPSGINNWEVVTGSFQDANSAFHGFLRRPDGTFTTFQAPGADTSPFNGTSPASINDFGVITGSYADATGFSHGFLRSPDGKFTSFDVPGAGGYGTTPIALNLEGAVVGYYTDANFLFHAFLRNPEGKFTTFVGPSSCDTNGSQGCFGTAAFNINLFGTIAAGYEDNSGNFVGHGIVRSPKGEITTYEVPGAGEGSYQGTGCPGCALGLNQWGAIAGIYFDANSVQHGFVRNPKGEFRSFDAPGAGTGVNQGTGCPSDCPVSINDWGAITGVYIDSNDVFHGYLRSPAGKFATIDPKGSAFTFPVGINDAGVITGQFIDANGVYHGFIRIPD
jgi:hypothetical protein